MYNAEYLQEKWSPLLNCEGLDPIKDSHRRGVTAILLENQERALREERGFLSEAPTMTTGTGGFGGGTYGTAAASGPVAGFDPVLISLIRRSMPQLIAYDICGVQPMTGPTGLIFAMRTRYGTDRTSGTEAFFNEADSRFSGQDSDGSLTASDYTAQASVGIATTAAQTGSNPAVLNDASAGAYNVGQAMATANAEALGDSGQLFNEMNFSIEKVTVAAKSRALKAEYSLELAQDLKAVHGLDAEAELANILSTEILAEINREVVRTVYQIAEAGAQANTATAGIFDLDVDSNGRWSVEKFKGLLFQLERDANAIAQRTRRGKGNTIICSADVASALTMAGVLDYTPALQVGLNVDDTGSTFAGVINGKYKVYIDPYSANISAQQYYVIGFKGATPYDAGLFYCPYVPLQMVRAVGQDTFQPKIGFKTRYGMVANPFAEGTDQGLGRLKTNSNRYYRRVQVKNLM